MTQDRVLRHSSDFRHGHPRPLEIRCRGCGFLLVVNDTHMAEQMGWDDVRDTEGTGLCVRCSRDWAEHMRP